MVFVEELAALELVGGGVLGGENGGVAGEAVGEGVLGRTLFAGCGAAVERSAFALFARLRGVGVSGWGLGIGFVI